MKLGIAFSGGGCRGSSHLGIAKALHENGIKPEIFAGTSAGAIVASLLACDIEPEHALDVLKNATHNLIDVDYIGIIKKALDLKLIDGLAKGEVLENALEDFFKGMNITSVQKPLAIITTDINSGRQIVFNNKPDGNYSLICDHVYNAICDVQTPLSYLITASCSLPAIYQPKPYGSYNLVDGGLVNNLPADAVMAMGADRVISVDLGMADDISNSPTDIVHVITQSISIFMERGIDNDRQDFDIYLNPQIYDVHVLDTSRIDECFDRGYKYAIDNMDKIKEQLGGNQNV